MATVQVDPSETDVRFESTNMVRERRGHQMEASFPFQRNYFHLCRLDGESCSAVLSVVLLMFELRFQRDDFRSFNEFQTSQFHFFVGVPRNDCWKRSPPRFKPRFGWREWNPAKKFRTRSTYKPGINYG